MKKLFLLAAAVMASFSLWAGVNVISSQKQVITDGDWIITAPDASPSKQNSVVFPDPAAETGFPTGSTNDIYYVALGSTSNLGAKLAENKRITIKGLSEGDKITLYGFANNTTKTTMTLSYATASNAGAKISDAPQFTPVSKQIVKVEFSALTEADITHIETGYEGTEKLAYISSNNSVYVYAIKIVGTPKSPSLKAIKIAGVDAVIDQAAGTITAELPYGSNVEAAIAAIAEADVTLGGNAVSYEIAAGKLTVSDGAEGSKEYTFALTVAASASTDATLKSLKINGVDVEGFAADELSYEYEIAYAAELPVVTAEVNDPTANAVINNVTEVPGTATVVVTPQSGDEDKVTYSIAFTRKAAATGNAITAFKLNGIPGLIDAENHAIVVNYADFLASVDAATPVITISELATIDKNGAQDFTAPVVYTVTSEAGEPQEWTVTVNIDAIPALAKANMPYTSAEDWDATPAFMYIVDGAFTANYQGGDYAGHNVIRINAEGAVYFQLAACDSIHVVASATGTRNYRLEVVGGDKAVQLDSKGKNTGHEIKLAVESENPVLVKFSTPGANGGATLRSVKVFYTAKGGTALGNTEAELKAVKRIVNGQLLIEKNGVLYNAQGAIVK